MNLPTAAELSSYIFVASRFSLKLAAVLLLTYVLALALTLLLTWRPRPKAEAAEFQPAGLTRPAQLQEVRIQHTVAAPTPQAVPEHDYAGSGNEAQQ